jgi:hypothetical protein
MAKRVRYVLEEGAPFSFHSEGLTIHATTRKSEVPVVIEVEGLTRKRLVQLQAAIHQELVRREQSWKQQRILSAQFAQEQPTKPAQQQHDCPAA